VRQEVGKGKRLELGWAGSNRSLGEDGRTSAASPLKPEEQKSLQRKVPAKFDGAVQSTSTAAPSATSARLRYFVLLAE